MEKLDKTIRDLKKKYDSGVIMDLRKNEAPPKVERVPVDSPKIGELLGYGGYARGRVIVIYGPESGGKTSLCSYMAGTCQKTTFEYMTDEGELKERKGVVVFIDAEHSFDPEFAKVHNFDISQCILVQPDNGEQALHIAIELISTGEVDMVIIDSLAACTPIAEIEADMDQMQMGLQARMFSKFFRKAIAITGQTKTTVLCTNQIRDSIGMYSGGPQMPGGRAIRFYSSVLIEVKRKDWVMDGNDPSGIIIAAKSIKNKTAPPMKKHLLEMSFTKGFDSHLEWIDYAIQYDIIQNPGQGSYILYNGTKVRGKGKVIDFYSDPENSEEYDIVIAKTKERMYAKAGVARVSVDSEEDEKEVRELLDGEDPYVEESQEEGEK
jgi:recombination protein RecA